MLCASEVRKYVPHGRLNAAIHPGPRPTQHRQGHTGLGVESRAQPLLSMFNEFNINTEKEKWQLQQSPSSNESCDEELYVSGQTVTWSRGVNSDAVQVLRSFTMASPVIQATWCNFVLPVHSSPEYLIAEQHGTAYEGQSSVKSEDATVRLDSVIDVAMDDDMAERTMAAGSMATHITPVPNKRDAPPAAGSGRTTRLQEAKAAAAAVAETLKIGCGAVEEGKGSVLPGIAERAARSKGGRASTSRVSWTNGDSCIESLAGTAGQDKILNVNATNASSNSSSALNVENGRAVGTLGGGGGGRGGGGGKIPDSVGGQGGAGDEVNGSGGTIAIEIQSSVCIREAGCISVFSADGKDYMCALPFLVKKMWSIKNGLLFEREVTEPAVTDPPSTPPQKGAARQATDTGIGIVTSQPQNKLPVLFTLSHPLDEMSPVICRTGGGGSLAKVSFVTEVTQEVVHTSVEPSVIFIYDRLLGVHSIWRLRHAKQEEAEAACGITGTTAYNTLDTGATSSCSYQQSRDHSTGTPITLSQSGAAAGVGASHSMSRFTLSTSHSPSLDSPTSSSLSTTAQFKSYRNQRLHSPRLNQSHTAVGRSPSLSRLAAFSRSQSPGAGSMTGAMAGGGGNLYRLHTPSPQLCSSPMGFQSPAGCSALSYSAMSLFNETLEPLQPDICLDHLWTESAAAVSRDGAHGAAAKVFESVDLGGQQYFCFLVHSKHQLRCLKYEESNDGSQLIFGSVSVISALDAVPLVLNAVYLPGLPSTTQPFPTVPFDADAARTGRRVSYMVDQRGMPCLSRYDPHTPASGPVTSSRPTSAVDPRFNDEVAMLSPVPTEFNESSHLVETSSVAEGDASFQHSSFAGGGLGGCVIGSIISLSDPVNNRFTVELTDGSLYRSTLPDINSSPITLQFLSQWYCSHNAPGGGKMAARSEWSQFESFLLTSAGYTAHPLLTTLLSADNGSKLMKKPRLSDEGSSEDWNYMLSSAHHRYSVSTAANHITGLRVLSDSTSVMMSLIGDLPADSAAATRFVSIETSSLLFQHLFSVFYALHLVYEELKLDIVLQNELTDLGILLYHIARDLRCELYMDHYCRDIPHLFGLNRSSNILQESFKRLVPPTFFSQAPANIYQWLDGFLHGRDCLPFPCLPGRVGSRCEHVITMYAGMLNKDSDLGKLIRKVSAAGRRVVESQSAIKLNSHWTVGNNQSEKIVLYMAQMDASVQCRLAEGVLIPLREAVVRCRKNPPSWWPEQAYTLVGREDLAQQCREESTDQWNAVLSLRASLLRPSGGTTLGAHQTLLCARNNREEAEGINCADNEVLKLRFSKDLRANEARRILQSAHPVRVAIQQRPEVSDHEFIEEQERYLYATCIRTMALPVGRGMFTLCTYNPIPTEPLHIPTLCLTGRAPPRNTAVDLSHIDTPPNMSHWPQFHNGVAAGLRITKASQLESSWILFNRAKNDNLTNEHAGFLMGQGLNGHLSRLATLNLHDYLIKGHEMTSMGLLLGMAANKRGSMDITTTKLLSIHVAALLPPTSTELDVPHNVQVAAVLGVGLVYMGTAHRHIAEVLLSEIGRPAGPEAENCQDRESYSLSAGLALGMVMLTRGSSEVLGLSDLGIPDQLYTYMVGGQKKQLTGIHRERMKCQSYQIKEGECVNVNVTSPGATLALGLMFFDTCNSSVANWLVAPDTQSLLDLVRPDLLMLRIIAHGLVMWQSVQPTEEWINSNLPQIVSRYAFNKLKYANDPNCSIDFETMSQAYCNIVGGACMVVGLKFAGSANKSACDCLYMVAIKLLVLISKPQLVEQAGKTTAENCLVVVILSLAMVMAGTGDLSVLRLCRYLRSRVGPPYSYVLYGSHMAIAMATGLLFLGGGQYTLSTTPESIAVMLCAFFPKFPNHSNDNRYHLQAFRHLYVLAVEKRLVIPTEVTTNRPCYVQLQLVYENGIVDEVTAPCILPELKVLNCVRVQGPDYWPIKFKKSENWTSLKKLLSGTGCLFVKHRTGGYLAPTERQANSSDIEVSSTDPFIRLFAQQFCTYDPHQDYTVSQLMSQALSECLSQEKLEVLTTLITLYRDISDTNMRCRTIRLWQLKLLVSYYERMNIDVPLVSQEFLMLLQCNVQTLLDRWISESGPILGQFFRCESIRPQSSSSSSSFIPATTMSDSLNFLSLFLSWYSVPHPKALAQMGLHELPSFPSLYKVLRPSGLPISSIMALSAALRAAAEAPL